MIFQSHYLNWDELLFDRLSNTAEASVPGNIHPSPLPNLHFLCYSFFDIFSTGTHLNGIGKVLDGDWLRLSS